MAVDPGAAGAYAWEFSSVPHDAGHWIADDVLSLGVEERTTGAGKVRRRTSAEVLTDELRTLIMWARADGDRVELVAYVEDPMPAPGQSSSTTASQHRSVGRIEGVLVALGFRVVLVTPQRVRRALGLASVHHAADMLGAEEKAAKKTRKTANLARALAEFPHLAPRIGDDDNRADALLVLAYAQREES